MKYQKAKYDFNRAYQKAKANSGLIIIVFKVVFKNLKLISHSQRENTSKELFQRLQGKPFWIWNIEEHKQKDIKNKVGLRDKCSLKYILLFCLVLL
jgi:hypothetical protein